MPRLTALFEPALLEQMRALAQLRDLPLYQLINDGCRLVWANLSDEERTRVNQILGWKNADRETRTGTDN